MSLVTTAIAKSAASARHRAATSAVLPEPTGPPMPMRTARRWAWVSGACRSSCTWISGRKETHLPGGVIFGVDVELGSGAGGQVVDRGVRALRTGRRDRVAGGRQFRQQFVHPVGVEAEQ